MRLRQIVLAALYWLLLPGILFAQERTLKGQVLLVGEQDELSPEVGVEVTITETGDTTRTRAQGLFRLFLPDLFKAGETVTLSVSKEDWVIQYPLDGVTHIPADLEKQMIKVRLLPKGSKKLWSADRIEKLIQDVAEKAKAQVRLKGKAEEIDFNRYIKDWATQYGFTAQQAKTEIDKWVAEVQQKQEDIYKLGLAAHAEKNFGKAGELFTESAETKAKQLKRARQEVEQLTEEIVRDFRLAGDAYYNNYRFAKALAAYQQALAHVAREKTPRLWAAVVTETGSAHWQIGIHTEGLAVHHYLAEAVAAYRAALEVRTRKELPQDWAMTQNNLAQAYTALEDWPHAAASYANVIRVYPDDTEAYQAVSFLYHERLFAFPEAFTLNQQWLERHPEDVAAQSDFAERYLTTGRFKEAATRLAALLADPRLDPGVRIALRTLEIAPLLALDQTTSIPSKLESLRGAITTRPEDFRVGWSFEGTKHFVSQNKRLAPFRGWLLELFAAMGAKDRDTLLGALDAVRVKFHSREGGGS